MTIHFARIPGQSPLGVFTNLWPTPICRRDRQTIEGWYLDVHLGRFRLSFLYSWPRPKTLPITKELPMPKLELTPELRRFLEVEVRNEDHGGVRPATVLSAIDSWTQAPDDVQREWTGHPTPGVVGFELGNLLWMLGDVELRSVL